MDIVMTINMAYFVLLIGVMMAVFALLTPGTGFLELGALGGLVVAGWAIFTLPINSWALFVLVLGVFPFMMALRKTKRKVYLAVSAGTMAFGSAYLFQGSEWWLPGVNPLVALVGSVSSGWLLWIMAVKVMEADAIMPTHNLNEIVGSIAETRSTVYHEGSVYADGELWSARSLKQIKQGKTVRILGREGLILLVEEDK